MEARRYIDTHGRHAWLYERGNGATVIEHCMGGRWHACALAPAGASVREVNMAAMKHLKRKPHEGALALRLLGTHHAGGGVKHKGQWIKGPREGS